MVPLAEMTGVQWLGVVRWVLVAALVAIGLWMVIKLTTRRHRQRHLRAWLDARGLEPLAIRPAPLGGAFLWAMPWHGVFLAALEGDGETIQGWLRVNAVTGAVRLRPLERSRRADVARQMLGGAAMGFAVLIVLGLVLARPYLTLAGLIGAPVLTWGCFKAGARNLGPRAEPLEPLEKGLQDPDGSL